MPRARRKGGRYVYPAGAYRQAMIAPPASMPPVIETVLPLQPVTVPEQTAVPLPAETEKERKPFWRYAAAGAAAVAVLSAAVASGSSTSAAAGLTKLEPVIEHRETAQLTDALPLPSLGVYIDLESLRGPLEEELSALPGDWALYLKTTGDGQELVINDHQMPSASLIKLFVAGCYEEKVESGAMSASARTENDLEAMISWSNNDAWQDLETCIGNGSYEAGLNRITQFAAAHGYKDTGRLIGGASIYAANAENLTSVSDVGRCLDEILSGTYVSAQASSRILGLMKEQHITTKIPAGLPDGIASANKTGELSGIENDAAIVYGLNTDYILVIMSDGNYVGTQPLAEISSMIYEALNPGGS